MGSRKEYLTFALDGRDKKRLMARAEELGLSPSTLVRMLIKEYLAELAKGGGKEKDKLI